MRKVTYFLRGSSISTTIYPVQDVEYEDMGIRVYVQTQRKDIALTEYFFPYENLLYIKDEEE